MRRSSACSLASGLAVGAVLGSCLLAFLTGTLLIGKYELQLGIGAIQTLAMIALVFGGEATLYSIRERGHLWESRPGTWVFVASVGDILIISALAIRGIAMQSLPGEVVASVLLAALLFAFLLDLVKVPVLRRLQIA